MKRIISILLLFTILILLVGCQGNEFTVNSDDVTESENNNTLEITIDYENAKDFEYALNNGERVANTIVRFDVLEYNPKSAFGVNCWSGEHLNFISDAELDVEVGDMVVGLITEEPTELLGSWIVFYSPLKIEGKTTLEDDVKTELESQRTERKNVTTTQNKSQPAKTQTEPAKEKPKAVYYSTNDYETAKKGNTGTFSYKNKSGSYDIYWIIDFDAGYIYNFTEGNGDTNCDKVKIAAGDLNDRITATWHDGGDQWSWYLHFKYKNHPETLVVNDHNGFAIEFTTTDLDDALSVRNTKIIRVC